MDVVWDTRKLIDLTADITAPGSIDRFNSWSRRRQFRSLGQNDNDSVGRGESITAGEAVVDHDPGETPAPGREVWPDEATFADIRELMTASLGHLGPAFALVNLGDGGLRAAAVDTETGQCLIELNDNTLHSGSFDHAIADYLVRTGKTEVPATAQWMRELVGLMVQARTLLRASEAAFVMGIRDVGLLRITRADVEEALNPAAVRAISLVRSVSLASPRPICAVVVMSDHVEWPGLPDEMSLAFDGLWPVLPICTSQAAVREGRHSHSPASKLPADSNSAKDNLTKDHVEYGVVPVPAPIQVPTTTPAYVPKTRTEPAPMPVPVQRQEPASLPDPLPEPFPGPTTEFTPVFDARAADRRQKQNRFVMAAAASVAAVIVAGGIIAAVGPWRQDTAGLESQRYLTTPTTSDRSTATTSAPAAPTSPNGTPVVPPINTKAALAPIVVYTTPMPLPAPPPTTRQAPPPRPRQNTIPNPIPGQPPIVLP